MHINILLMWDSFSRRMVTKARRGGDVEPGFDSHDERWWVCLARLSLCTGRLDCGLG
jgi:hypothetical protein